MRVTRFVEEAVRPPAGHTSCGHNVCGVLVHADPNRLDTARRRLRALPGVEIHGEGGDGRLVVTVEDTDEAPAALTLKTLVEIEGVASAALVYHHCETDGPTSGEMPS
ncbi:chaperone NapD [Azospirillum sp. ST 5-10]|uniref:chaperone NapD n=1 Tax=unclassified Azospirillum TaxID=2630922 RepID=UPI003F49C34C